MVSRWAAGPATSVGVARQAIVGAQLAPPTALLFEVPIQTSRVANIVSSHVVTGTTEGTKS